MKILVVNSGSSSIKFALYVMPQKTLLASGLIEQIGETMGQAKITTPQVTHTEKRVIANHQQGFDLMAKWLQDSKLELMQHQSEIAAVGHRVVHGGEWFASTTLITPAVKEKIKTLFTLAPLHNPPNLEGILQAEKVFTHAQNYAVFDTAFFHSLPEHAYTYALPAEMYAEHGMRVYGFHGTSHNYVSKQSATLLGKPLSAVNLITIHLGNGASMAAIKKGVCVDTTLGMTPLTGLIMGTRVGDLDPGALIFMQKTLGLSVDEVSGILNKDSGMKGLTGSNDMREVEDMAAKGNPRAQLALVMYAYRIKKYIGAYMAILGPIDALIFTAGVGENSSLVRQLVCSDLTHLGIEIATKTNAEKSHNMRFINTPASAVKVMVTPTNEELEIAEETFKHLSHA